MFKMKYKKYRVSGYQLVNQYKSNCYRWGKVSIDGKITIGHIEAKNAIEAKKIFREECKEFSGLEVAHLSAEEERTIKEKL